MKITLLIILTLLSYNLIYSQTREIRTVLEDTNDSILGKVKDLCFSEGGDYFYLNETDNNKSYVTNTTIIKLPERKNGTSAFFGKYGEISIYYITQDSFYYKNIKSTKYYKNGFGEVIQQITDFTHDNVALTTEKQDSIFHFLNGNLIAKNSKSDLQEIPSIDKWCSFSENGNVLYNFKKDDTYFIKLNNEIINSSDRYFIQLEVDNYGNYFYGTGKKGIPNTKFDYMFFPNYNELKFDSVRTIWDSYLNKNGGFYFSGGNPPYLCINGKYFEYPVPEDIILPDSINFFYFDDVKRNYTYHTANANKDLGNWKIIKPSMNRNGDFSFFLKFKSNYQILINGEIQNYKVIGKPISIDSKGNFITYIQTKKSTKIYRNNNLEIEKPGKIELYNRAQFFEKYLNQYRVNNIPKFDKAFDYFEIGNSGYIVWEGIISQPIKRMAQKTFGDEYPKVGELLAGAINEYGFYLFQYVGEKNTKLIFNNQIIDLEYKIDSILENSIFFIQNRIVFYAVIKNKVKRFEVTE